MEPNDASQLQFEWGKKRIRTKEGVQFYEDFNFDGEHYSLYDDVYLHKHGEPEPYIGKLVKIWESNQKRKVKVLWFFRPKDITNFLGDYRAEENELFLASGEGVGLFNVNPLEAIAGKCFVVCTSEDERNPCPSEEAVVLADYIFNCTFDVGTCAITNMLADKIAGIEVKLLLNREECIQALVVRAEVTGVHGNGRTSKRTEVREREKEADECDNKPPKKMKLSSDSMRSSDDLEKRAKEASRSHMEEIGSEKYKVPANVCDDKPSQKMKLSSDSDDLEKNKNATLTRKVHVEPAEDDSGKVQPIRESSAKMNPSEKNTKFPGELQLKLIDKNIKSPGELQLKACNVPVKRNIKFGKQILDMSRRPDAESSKWFKPQPWEVRLTKANEQGKLVFLQNFDRSLTSTDIEVIMYQVFGQSCTAKVLPQLPILTPHYGQAYVIFKTVDAADEVVQEINAGCFMLSNGRAFIASKGMLKMAEKASTIPGYLSLKRRNQQREDWRKAVSTSHCSQPNTIEYELALEWVLLQEKSDDCHSWLYKRQGSEIRQLRKNLKADV